MSANKRRGSRPPSGRDRIGPVLGLARAEQAIDTPVKHDFRREPNDKGALEVVLDRTYFERTTINGRLLALATGGVHLEKITPEVTLTPAQRQPVTYRPDGGIDFSNPRQVTDPEQWQELQSEGALLVVSGYVVRKIGAVSTEPQFNFQPHVWDIAEPTQHVSGRLALPVGELRPIDMA